MVQFVTNLVWCLVAWTGSLFARKTDKARMDEELALQVAEMIINDVTMTTRSRDDEPAGS